MHEVGVEETGPAENHVLAIRELQGTVDQVYGRLEAERALNWTLEELGEVARSHRRSESRERLTEELGQLAANVCCLANILAVDLADALLQAIAEERQRQLLKYGEPRPYRAPEVSGR